MQMKPLDPGILAGLVRDAGTAPSMHNAQPWQFRFLPDTQTLWLRADLARAMPTTDPDHRGLHLGCGAALFNLRVAAARIGRHPHVRLLPDPADQLSLATVDFRTPTPEATEAGNDALAELYPAILQRHTSRWPFAETALPERVRAALVDAARLEQSRLLFTGPWHSELLRDLVRDAEGRDLMDPGRTDDLERWTRFGDETEAMAEGVPEYAFGPGMRDGNAPVRDFAGRRQTSGRGSQVFEHAPHLALLGTAQDRPLDWLRAGQALERVLLVATLDDLVASLTSHALEWPDLRSLARDPLSAIGHVQMVLRVGYGPRGPASPRRPVNDILSVG
ncbi:nitroreductase [Streptomyces kunmingensis]|uniref:Nitroreductase n=1 Tax=Streptomyces kunmingensis TaxID=68225 RepID=A0ABU6CD84_9ACTN|nr:nitroreductase [Streptomyces kunmingensis]MEB3962684.1 nitroreductase [Streptomyces kunmingensis]